MHGREKQICIWIQDPWCPDCMTFDKLKLTWISPSLDINTELNKRGGSSGLMPTENLAPSTQHLSWHLVSPPEMAADAFALQDTQASQYLWTLILDVIYINIFLLSVSYVFNLWWWGWKVVFFSTCSVFLDPSNWWEKYWASKCQYKVLHLLPTAKFKSVQVICALCLLICSPSWQGGEG